MPIYHDNKRIGKIYRGDKEIRNVYQGEYLIFGKLPLRFKPDYGYFKLTTCDVNENPLGNIPILPRYGRDRVVDIEYSYDNVNWIASTSSDIIYSSPTGEIYLRCITPDNYQVNNSTNRAYPWKIGDNLQTYYKIEGDLKVLLDKDATMSKFMKDNCFRWIFSDHYYKVGSSTPPYINQCIDANVIVPTAGENDWAYVFNFPFGSKMRRATLWKDGQWGYGIDSFGEWSEMFGGQGTDVAEMEWVQVTHKSWPTGREIGTYAYSVKTPANTTFYIPHELPAEYGINRLPEGCKIVRYNVDNYGSAHSRKASGKPKKSLMQRTIAMIKEFFKKIKRL